VSFDEAFDRVARRASGHVVGGFVVLCVFVAVAGVAVSGWVEAAWSYSSTTRRSRA